MDLTQRFQDVKDETRAGDTAAWNRSSAVALTWMWDEKDRDQHEGMTPATQQTEESDDQ